MYRHTHTIIVAATVMLAAITFPESVSGQSAQAPTAAAPRAAAIEARAHALLDQRSKWGVVAALMEEAAALRPAGDPLAVQDIFLAASTFYYSGKKPQARAAYTRAGERALADGNVMLAARAFLSAALVANEERDLSVQELRARAERLASSPLLTEVQRRLILGQFGTAAPLQVATKQQ